MSFKKSFCKNVSLQILLTLLMTTTFNVFCTHENYDLSFQSIKELVHGGPLTKDFLKKMAALFKTKVFVETGTQYGYTLDNSREYFQDVYSTEIDSKLYKSAVKKFQKNTNVHLFRGDSPKALAAMLPNVKKSAFFWLDAHFSDAPVPIFGEIEAIDRYYDGKPILLVDDIRNFRRCSNFPSVEALRNSILKHNDDYEFVLLFDAALAFPRHLEITISPVLRACTLSYLSEKSVVDENELLKAEKIIALSAGQERELILKLHAMYPENPTYHIWAGLVTKHNQPRQALKHFENAEKVGCKHKRLQQYKNESLETI